MSNTLTLNSNPRVMWDGRDVVRNLFEQNNIDECVIYFEGYTDKPLTEDGNTIIATANAIKNSADKYAQFILQHDHSIYTKDLELLASSSSKKAHWVIILFHLKR